MICLDLLLLDLPSLEILAVLGILSPTDTALSGVVHIWNTKNLFTSIEGSIPYVRNYIK
jgi:hypothetical protein